MKSKIKKNIIRNESSYDSPAKNFLSNVDVVANILKELVPEYQNMNIENIKNHIDKSANGKYVKLLSSEEKRIINTTIYYDILFKVRVPHSKKKIGMYINLEPQSKTGKKYKLIRRAIYYACRLIAIQKGVDFVHQDFDSLEKVYSIWIDTNANTKKQGTINSYSINEKHIRGTYSEPQTNYDLMNVIFVYIEQNNNDKQYKDIMDLFRLVFIDNDTNSETKQKILKNSYGILNIEKEVQDMCNYGEVIAYKANKEGKQQGLTQGKRIGYIESSVDCVYSLCSSKNISIEEAVSILNIDKSIKDKVIQKVKEKYN